MERSRLSVLKISAAIRTGIHAMTLLIFAYLHENTLASKIWFIKFYQSIIKLDEDLKKNLNVFIMSSEKVLHLKLCFQLNCII